MDDADVEAAVEERRRWLDGQLQAAADRFHLTPAGETVNTYDMRSAGRPAHTTDGGEVWLRVVLEDPDYQPRCRWDGNVTASTIAGVPKPTVLDWADWDADDYASGRRLRGEIMSLAPGNAICQDSVLREDPCLPDEWWASLGSALTVLAKHPVPECDEYDTVGSMIGDVRDHFGVDLDPMVFDSVAWTTAHTDLHWGNLTGPQLCIVDWETWRRAPAGYDAATLYCASLLHAPTAQRVRTLFGSVLDAHSGRLALLAVIGRFLGLTSEDHLELEPLLFSLGKGLLYRL
ncbi:MAG: hypothetical protein JWQ81_5952 [Amycolatopsis sp.]|uniref:hypothetical protein n=1 Tax=Amycolatopsis sp. TaxID=37632 RepID=UPI00262A657D|nr:hypothetical protein [Amycolatopsis sp.]MCU1685213.1 hypothetical protein [Amycolatopsis sp.]